MSRCLQVATEDGLFTVRRNSVLFWSGTWSDMIIEQCLMRAGKTHGGLINITHNDSARTKWLLSVHILAQYSDALRIITNTNTGTWSEQHKELSQSRRKKDTDDPVKFYNFFYLFTTHSKLVTKM